MDEHSEPWAFHVFTRYIFADGTFGEQSSISYMSDHGLKRPVTGHLCDNGNATKKPCYIIN